MNAGRQQASCSCSTVQTTLSFCQKPSKPANHCPTPHTTPGWGHSHDLNVVLQRLALAIQLAGMDEHAPGGRLQRQLQPEAAGRAEPAQCEGGAGQWWGSRVGGGGKDKTTLPAASTSHVVAPQDYPGLPALTAHT